ncbi:DHA2 family efflux MFS transporter permease subunit [Pseudomonas sp. 7-41]|uniref:DHA2 family efflux MFS transporter permease subunit n=1 Tax=Pseudomonas sp. 7-41 TaxID=2898483 RepID=UPI001E3A6827|nr:DHA2 family efflux MFS transporter permease subunit [Pseudomonas sp. 7-41]UHG99543.1 DHA2 family efflux MFS transporter permease subunit [Pseudomonas sp. 7-41]
MSSVDLSPANPDSELSDKLDPHLLRLAAVVVLGAFMSILDTTVVNIAIQGLTKTFQAPLETTQWISTGYMLALTAIIPLAGWAADRFGTKRLYLTSILLFLIGSALSGAAWSMSSLIVFRVLQGLGGGMILPTGMTLLSLAAGPQRMGRLMGIVGLPIVLGPILGPTLGGWLVDDVSWRWIFFINLPIGAIALYAAYRVLDADESKPHHALDWTGFLLLSPGLGIFIYGLTQITVVGGFSSLTADGCAFVGLAMIVGFTLHALRRDDALIDIRLFGRRIVGPVAIISFLLSASAFGMSLLFPLYFQLVRGYSAFDTGLLVIVEGLGAVLAMPLSGYLVDKIGAGKVVLFGIVCAAMSVLFLSMIESTSPLWSIEVMLFIVGFGKGSTMMPATSAALSTLRKHEIARATSGLNVIQRAGGALGTALLAVILTGGISANSEHSGVTAALQQNLSLGLQQVFSHAFLCALVLIVLSGFAAMFLLRKTAVDGNGDATSAGSNSEGKPRAST